LKRDQKERNWSASMLADERKIYNWKGTAKRGGTTRESHRRRQREKKMDASQLQSPSPI